MSGRRAMTLIETLAVVGVSGALLGLLLPTLRGAREGAREAACAAGARTLQAANELHADAHEERYAPGSAIRRVVWSGALQTNLERWHGSRESGSQPFGAEGGALTPFLGSGGASAGVRACPSFRARLDELLERGQGFERGAGGYGYNNAFVGTEREWRDGNVWVAPAGAMGRGSLRGRFASPSRTIAFADGAFAGDEGVIEYSFVEPVFWADAPGMRPDPSVHFRHAGRANVVWLDGRVSTEAMAHSAWSGLYRTDPARVRIGWFGPDDSNELFDYE